MEKIKWGIFGTGFIAKTFTESMKDAHSSEVVAVYSRTEKSGEAFKQVYDHVDIYTDIDKFLNDSGIDAVYVASPHPAHKEQTLQALRAKKAVLCEKPLTLSYDAALEMTQCAKDNNVLLMEAVWTRFLPAILGAKKLIDEGVIGKIKILTADFGFDVGPSYDVSGRLYNKELGGGAMYDVGVYTLSMANYFVNKEPIKLQTSMIPTSTGVDGISNYTLTYEDAMAILYSAVDVNSRQELYISGELGSIHIPEFWHADRFSIKLAGGKENIHVFERDNTGYIHEIEGFNASLRAGELENSVVPHKDTLAVMSMVDNILEQF